MTRPGVWIFILLSVGTVQASNLEVSEAEVAKSEVSVSEVSDTEWRHHGGTLKAQRYSALDQINADNVGELEIAWRWSARNFGPSPERKYITTPLMVDGVLYATAGIRRAAVALDPSSGETLWTYRLDEGQRTASAPRRNSGRGVAYWSDGKGDARVFLISPGYQLVALSAADGRPIEDFGASGVVDLRVGLGADVDPLTSRIGSSSPPLIVGMCWWLEPRSIQARALSQRLM